MPLSARSFPASGKDRVPQAIVDSLITGLYTVLGMADLLPFRALRYNPEIVGDLSLIICPPFDTISSELQESLHRRSPYNIVRLEAGGRLPSDTSHDNRYTRSAALFTDWIEWGVLAREVEPAFYLIQHTFEHRGREWARLELMGCIRLEEYQRRVVLPHEYTRDEDKRDRLALMRACHANFSPIMCLYRDEDKRLAPIFHRTMAEPPIMEFSDAGGQDYRMWKIDDGGRAREISEVMSLRPLYIADGHHRYETALTYRDLMVSGHGEDQAGHGAFNFVMMGLIEFDDPGLMVLPYHRILGGLDESALARVRDGLREHFDQDPFPEGGRGGLEKFLEEIEVQGRSQLVMGVLDPGGAGRFQLLTLKRGSDQGAWGPVARSEAWILEEQVLRPILGDSLAQCLNYVHEGVEAEQRVRSGEYQLGFFLKPFPLGLFETIMDKGQRLPPKSTFFYPKLPTGLVINLLEGKI